MDNQTKIDIEWVLKENHALNDYANVVRYLLNKVEELESRIESLTLKSDRPE